MNELINKMITKILIVRNTHTIKIENVKFKMLDTTTQQINVKYIIDEQKFEYSYIYEINNDYQINEFLFCFNRVIRNKKNK